MSEPSVTENTTTTITPGTWFVRYVEGDRGAGGIAYIKADTGHREVCVIYCDDPAHQMADAQAISAVPDLIAALRDLLADIDSGLLVRDITRDGDPSWTRHMLAFVQRLHAAKAALAKAGVR